MSRRDGTEVEGVHTENARLAGLKDLGKAGETYGKPPGGLLFRSLHRS